MPLPNWSYNNQSPVASGRIFTNNNPTTNGMYPPAFNYPTTNGMYPSTSPSQAYSHFTNLIRVYGGLEGAKAYPLGPNSMVALFDSDSDIFYLKSTDASGFPTIQIADFQFRDTENKETAASPNRSIANPNDERIQAMSDQILEMQISLEEIKKEISNGKQHIWKSEPENARQSQRVFESSTSDV